MKIKVMKRITKENKEQAAKLINEYYPYYVPHVGEILWDKYEIVEVIYVTPVDVVLEVKEYDKPEPLITKLPLC